MTTIVEYCMATIVEYDRKSPENQYPYRIVSPPRPIVCCFSEMEDVGCPHREAQWEYRYRRYRTCGFTVHVIHPTQHGFDRFPVNR